MQLGLRFAAAKLPVSGLAEESGTPWIQARALVPRVADRGLGRSPSPTASSVVQ
jgi:hypothetical protein